MKITKKNKISRKEALKTMGKYAAVTAVGTFMILNPKKSHAQSSPGGTDDLGST